MFRVDPGFFIPYVPPGHALALIPVIPRPNKVDPTCFAARAVSDEFRMYEFKVRKCGSNRAHDWTVCPWAHPGERARRRDPRRVPYKAAPCEEYRLTQRCRRGDACEYAHGVFEYWLHPSRYRTRACTSGPACNRQICFFADRPHELRAQARYPPPPMIKAATEAEVPIWNSEGSNLVECEGDDQCEMPDFEWIKDLIGC